MDVNVRKLDVAGNRAATGWPNLAFLGIGGWWAWILLCFDSAELLARFPDTTVTSTIFWMFLLSNGALIVTLLVCSLLWRKATHVIEHRFFVLVPGAVAGIATYCVGICFATPVQGPLFVAASLLTGVGTGFLALGAGCMYGRVSLSEGMTGCAISLALGTLLYFVGIGIPVPARLLFISALPLLAAVVMTMPVEEPYPSAIQATGEGPGKQPAARRHMLKISVAFPIIAFTACVGKGIDVFTCSAADISYWGSVACLSVLVIAFAIIYLCSRVRGPRGIKNVYTLLMVMGIVLMLATCFGLNIFCLEIGKVVLWMLFFCFTSYLVFKFDLSAVRTTGLLLAWYYVGSIAGWLAGAALAPYYADATVRMAVGICLAVVVILVLLFVFTEQDVRYIVENSYFEEAGKQDVAAVGFSALTVDTSTLRSLEPDGVQSAQGDDPAQAVTDNLANARDPKYGLSQRELEILEPFAQGRSANWIADNFFISKNTVRSHLRNIYGKLDVHTRQELLDLLNGKEE